MAKVTGQAKYAEDFRAEGMLFTKLLLSPMPHARVRNIDATAALAMPGVHAILTEEDCPRPDGPMFLGEGVTSTPSNVPIALPLTNEPVHQGEPILAVAADSEQLAADAIERIVVDPIQALRPGSPDPREQGNAWVGNQTTAELAGELAIVGAVPLQHNGYKVPLMRNLVKRAIRGAKPWTS